MVPNYVLVDNRTLSVSFRAVDKANESKRAIQAIGEPTFVPIQYTLDKIYKFFGIVIAKR